MNEILREIRDGNVRALQNLLIKDPGEVNTFNEVHIYTLNYYDYDYDYDRIDFNDYHF